MADLMVQQQYWAGGSHSVEVQSSRCFAEPLVRTSDWQWGLFEVQETDQSAEVVTCLDQTSWVSTIVSFVYGVVSLVLIINGVFRAIVQTRLVWYIPLSERFVKDQRVLRYLLPSMRLASLLPHREGVSIRFKGNHGIMGSDLWLNHWLYIAMSILEACSGLRMMYICLEMGTWLLNHEVNFGNFIFLCSALTRITWLMCLVHTCLLYLVKLSGCGLQALGAISESTRLRLDRYADGVSCFLNYKIYSVALCMVLYGFLVFHGSITFQKSDPPFKRASLGGDANVQHLWGSEIVCDLTVILFFHTCCGVIFGVIMMTTPYRFIVNNSLVRTLQRRYFVVGWDVFLVAELLNMDPFDPKLVKDGVALTNCSFGSVLQVLYAATPSGLVDLAGDSVLLEGGFNKDPVEFHFTPKRANQLDLFRTPNANQVSSAGKRSVAPAVAAASAVRVTENGDSDVSIANDAAINTDKSLSKKINNKSLFERTLRVVTESHWGRILLVDHDDPGRFRCSETGVNEFVVCDALSMLSIRDIKHLLGNKEALHIT